MKVSYRLGSRPVVATLASSLYILLLLSLVHSITTRSQTLGSSKKAEQGADDVSAPDTRPLSPPKTAADEDAAGPPALDPDNARRKIAIAAEHLGNPNLASQHERLTRSWGALHAFQPPRDDKPPKRVSFNLVPTVINGPGCKKLPPRPPPRPWPDLSEISFETFISQGPEKTLLDLRSSGYMGLRSSMKDSYQKLMEHSLDDCLMLLVLPLEHKYDPFKDPNCLPHYSDDRYRRLVDLYLERVRSEFGKNALKTDPSTTYQHHRPHPPVDIQQCDADKGQQHIPKTPQPIRVPPPMPSKSPRAVLYIMALLLTIFVIGACLYMILVAFAL